MDITDDYIENKQFCQCCTMFLDEIGELKGTNADGGKNGDY